jgi:hypothetical protein
MVIFYIFFRFGMLHREKSGNPALLTTAHLLPQATSPVPRGARKVVPAVQRHEDGARAARTPLGRGPALRRGPLVPGVRRVPRGTGDS